jgi:nickel transport protein
MRATWFVRTKSKTFLWAPKLFLLLLMGALAGAAMATPPAPLPSETKATAGAMDQQMLEEVVARVLERQLAPVKEMLAELTLHRTSLTDIIGGIGYILGLFGLWAYCLSKRKKDS